MGNYNYCIGKVIKGDHDGYSVIEHGDEWLIVSRTDKFSERFIKQIISKETVEYYFELGQQREGPNIGAMGKWTLYAGVAGGLIAEAATNLTTATVAFYMKNGKSFLVSFDSIQGWHKLKFELYALEYQAVNHDLEVSPEKIAQQQEQRRLEEEELRIRAKPERERVSRVRERENEYDKYLKIFGIPLIICFILAAIFENINDGLCLTFIILGLVLSAPALVIVLLSIYNSTKY